MKDDEIRSKLADLKLNLVHSNRNIIHEKVLAWSPCIIAEMETGTIIFGQSLKGLRKDGSEFNLKISLEPFYYEQKGYVLATIIQV